MQYIEHLGAVMQTRSNDIWAAQAHASTRETEEKPTVAMGTQARHLSRRPGASSALKKKLVFLNEASPGLRVMQHACFFCTYIHIKYTYYKLYS